MTIDILNSSKISQCTTAKVQARPSSSTKSPSRVLPSDFYQAFLSSQAKSRKASPIRHLLHHELKPNMLTMLAGKPNPQTFPFASISMAVRSPDRTDSSLTEIVIRDDDLDTALQYNQTSGIPELVQWLTELNMHVHGIRQGEGWRVSVGSGSQDLLYKAFSALVSPGDSIFLEAPTYPGVLPAITALNCKVIDIVSDAEGIIPASLSSALENWPANTPFPKLLYTVPYGSNPTGMTTTLVRRLEVLNLARKYNFIIMEDDPYYHLYYGAVPRPPSYLSLERLTDGEIGRVLRFDSMSKILASGFRIGWVTGPQTLVDAIDRHSGYTTMQPPTISQMMVLKLVGVWGIEGFLTHTNSVAEFYRQKKDVFEAALQRHMKGLAEWSTPNAAMFFWLKLCLPPSVRCETIRGDEGDSALFVSEKAVDRGLLFLPGECASFEEKRGCYVRLSFSLLDGDQVDEAFRRLAALLREG